MFFCALTRSPLSNPAAAKGVREVALGGGWRAILAADAGVEQDANGSLTIRAGHGQVPFLEARFDPASKTLYVEKFVAAACPAYYHHSSAGEFFFSNTIAGLREAGVAIEENRDVLPEFFIYLSVAPPRTIYRGIRQIPTWGKLSVQWTPKGCTVSGSEYCEPLKYEKVALPPELEVAGRVAEIVRASVKRMGFRSESTGALLSGGMDSTVLCKILVDDCGLDKTYSTSYPFETPAEDFERAYGVSAGAELGTSHETPQPSSAEFLECVIDAIADTEMPLAHLQSVLLYWLFRDGLPRERSSILSGEAASTFGPALNVHLLNGDSAMSRFLASAPGYAMLSTARAFWGRARGVSDRIQKIRGARRPLSDPDNSLWSLGARGDYAWVASFLNADRAKIIGDRYAAIQKCEGMPLIDTIWFYNLGYDLNDTVLGWSAMAASQGRVLCVPFLCQELIDYVGSLPWELRYRIHKYVLLITGKRLGVSDNILWRKKLSFGLSPEKWARRGTAFEPLLALAAKSVPEQELRRLQTGGYGTSMTYWALLNYGIWKQIISGVSRDELKGQLREQMARVRA